MSDRLVSAGFGPISMPQAGTLKCCRGGLASVCPGSAKLSLRQHRRRRTARPQRPLTKAVACRLSSEPEACDGAAARGLPLGPVRSLAQAWQDMGPLNFGGSLSAEQGSAMQDPSRNEGFRLDRPGAQGPPCSWQRNVFVRAMVAATCHASLDLSTLKARALVHL